MTGRLCRTDVWAVLRREDGVCTLRVNGWRSDVMWTAICRQISPARPHSSPRQHDGILVLFVVLFHSLKLTPFLTLILFVCARGLCSMFTVHQNASRWENYSSLTSSNLVGFLPVALFLFAVCVAANLKDTYFYLLHLYFFFYFLHNHCIDSCVA